MNRAFSLLGVFTLIVACQGSISGATGEPPTPPPGPHDPPVGPVDPPIRPHREPVGPASIAPGRALRRMTAAQFNRSLAVTTGQEWADYERYAAALGRADFAEVTEEGLDFNVTFEKLVEDAARETCRAAAAADAEGVDPVLLRHATISSRDDAEIEANLVYLFRRFLGQRIDADNTRLDPLMTLLTTPAAPGQPLDDATMESRWAAVCVALVTHADFVSY